MNNVPNESVATPTKVTEQNSGNRENRQQQRGSLEQQQQRKPIRRMYVPMPGIYVGRGPYPRYYTMTFNEQSRRSVNPYSIIKKVEEITEQKPKAVTGNNRSSFTIETVSKEQAEKMQQIKEVENFPCTIACIHDLTTAYTNLT